MTKKKELKKGKFVQFFVDMIFPLIASFVIGGILIMLVGDDPFNTYVQMISKALFEKNGLFRTFHVAAPLLLTGLAIAITFKANIYNMGVEGQALLGGFTAAIVGSYLKISSPLIHTLICFILAMAVGMAAALIPAVLKAYFNVNEIVATLMLNYMITEILTFLCEGIFKDPSPVGYVSTPKISDSAMINKFGLGDMTWFSFLAIAVGVIFYIMVKKTKLGFEMRAIGYNQEFSEATGMNVRKKIIVFMMLSGAIAGLAGAGWMLSEKFRYSGQFSGSPGLGWDGMLISLLGANNPVGVGISAVLYSALKVGMSKIELFTNVPKEIVGIIQAFMVLFLSAKYYKKGFFGKLRKKMAEQGRDKYECSK